MTTLSPLAQRCRVGAVEARRRLLALAQATELETVALADALGRVLAKTLRVEGSRAGNQQPAPPGGWLAAAGDEVKPTLLALLAAFDQKEVTVHRRPRVHLSGPTGTAQTILTATAREGGAFITGEREADLILALGDGLSEGLKTGWDWVLSSTAHRPGLSLKAGKRGSQILLILDDAADTAVLAAEWYVKPLLRLLSGHRTPGNALVPVTLLDWAATDVTYQRFLPAVVYVDGESFLARPLEDPEALPTLVLANALLFIQPAQAPLSPNTRAHALLLDPPSLGGNAQPLDGDLTLLDSLSGT